MSGRGSTRWRSGRWTSAARYARLQFATRIPLAPGDRIVLRDAGRECTVAGADVLDVEPSGAARDAAARLELPVEARLLARAGRVAVVDVPRLTGLSDAAAGALVTAMVESGLAVLTGDALVDVSRLTALRERARALVRASASPGVDLATLASGLDVDTGELRLMLEGDEQLVVERGIVRDAADLPVEASPEAAALVAALDASPFSPPEPASAGADPALVRALVRHGELVDIGGVVFTAVGRGPGATNWCADT